MAVLTAQRRPTHPTPSPAHPPIATAAMIEALAAVLEGLIREHEGLAALTRAQRAAIAAADGDELNRITKRQRDGVQAVATLDAQRHELVGQLASRLGLPRPPAGGGVTITALAAAVPSAGAERLRALAERLRETLLAVQREHRVVRSAAETIFSHIDGMMDQIARRLSHAATYSRRGAPPVAPQFASALDLTS